MSHSLEGRKTYKWNIRIMQLMLHVWSAMVWYRRRIYLWLRRYGSFMWFWHCLALKLVHHVHEFSIVEKQHMQKPWGKLTVHSWIANSWTYLEIRLYRERQEDKPRNISKGHNQSGQRKYVFNFFKTLTFVHSVWQLEGPLWH